MGRLWFVGDVSIIFQRRKLWNSMNKIARVMMQSKLFFQKRVQSWSSKTTSIIWECQLWFMPTLSHSQNRLTHVNRILTEASRKLTKSMNRLDFAFTWSVLTNLQNQSCLQKQERKKMLLPSSWTCLRRKLTEFVPQLLIVWEISLSREILLYVLHRQVLSTFATLYLSFIIW